MNGFLFFLPFLLIRFGFLSLLSKTGLQRAATFAPLEGKERIAYIIYQLSNLALLVVSCFFSCNFAFSWHFYLGFILYSLGLALCACSVLYFAYPDKKGFNDRGVYRFSRNPMYVSYFICFLGISILIKSWLFFFLLLIFQISAHWIIRSEERWCLQQFGKAYQDYQERVGRYI